MKTTLQFIDINVAMVNVVSKNRREWGLVRIQRVRHSWWRGEIIHGHDHPEQFCSECASHKEYYAERAIEA